MSEENASVESGSGGQTTPAAQPRGRAALLQRHRWLVFVLPFAVYMIAQAAEPRKPVAKVRAPAPETAPESSASPADAAEPGDGAAKTPSEDGEDAGADKGAGSDGPDAEDGAPAEASEQPPPEAPGDAPAAADQSASRGWLPASPIPYRYYPIVCTVKIVLTLLAIVFVWPGLAEFPCHVSPLAFLVGAAGIIVWLGFCELKLEQKYLVPLGAAMESFVATGERSGYNPFWSMRDQPDALVWGFIAVRLFGLVVVVAIAEELFLRGFLMRFVMQADWWEVPFGKVNVIAFLVVVLYAVLSHPAELFAAAVWFSLVTLLMMKTRNLWDCVTAHAVTNLLLGIYVVALRQWQYW